MYEVELKALADRLLTHAEKIVTMEGRLATVEKLVAKTTVPAARKKTGWVVIYRPSQNLNERSIYLTELDARKSVNFDSDDCAFAQIEWTE